MIALLPSRGSLRRLTATAALGLALTALAVLAPARALAAEGHPGWSFESRAAPTRLPAQGAGLIIVTANNLTGPVNGETSEVVMTDLLPVGIEATAVTAHSDSTLRIENKEKENPVTHEVVNPHGWGCAKAGEEGEREKIVCTYQGQLPTGERLELWIDVKTHLAADAGCTTSCPENEVTITPAGEGEPPFKRPLKVSERTSEAGHEAFGVEGYELAVENEDGRADTQAGSHPYQFTSTFNLNESFERDDSNVPVPTAPALERTVSFNLPAGLLGDPDAVPQCSGVDFGAEWPSGKNNCPEDTQIGVADLTLEDPFVAGYHTGLVPVFNLAPSGPGEPARFGFALDHVPVVLDTSLRSGSDYGVTVSVHNATQSVQVMGAKVTIWGVPYAASHDEERGWACLYPESGCGAEKLPENATAFLTMPSSCSVRPVSTMSGESWPYEEDGKTKTSYIGAEAELPRFTGCGTLDEEFDPSIGVEVEKHETNTPTGMTVHVHIPQESALSPTGLARSAVRDTTVTLPPGVLLNPSAANGLLACAEAEHEGSGGIGFTGNSELDAEPSYTAPTFTPSLSEEVGSFCPNASEVGEVHISTPDLREELVGGVYIAAQNANPFGSLFAIYLVAQEPTTKVTVKLAGEVHLNEQTGQITTVFRNTPDVSFENLTLTLFGGSRANLTTPPGCGTPASPTQASFTPWAEEEGKPGVKTPAVEEATGFDNTNEAEGGPGCGSSQPFTPSFAAGASNTQAAAYSPFELTIAKPDADQALTGVSITLPPGMAAMISSITPCPEPAASEGTCATVDPNSEIGKATATVGLGGEPYTVKGGRVFFTGPYDGAPFGLSVTVPAEAGPFHFGEVVTRSTITVNPSTAQVTINSPLPTMVTTSEYPGGTGVPVQLKQIHVEVNRPDFEFNPTNCTRMEITGTLSGAGGASFPVKYPFQASECASLPFHPKLTATVGGHGSKAGGDGFNVTVTSAGLGQANIAKVFLTIPKILPARLQPTLQHACVAAVFEANPANCPEDSVIGMATIHTPVFKNPLTGPAYVISHAGASFPDVEFVLQGEGVEIILDGKTDIKKGVTYSRFESSPDAPFTTFETSLPAGPHSILAINTEEAADYDLCGKDITMPTEIYAQNGDLLKQTTKLSTTGCSGTLANKTSKPSRAQKLSKALAACRKKYAGSRHKSKRASCEKTARKKYGKQSAKKTSKKK